MPPPPAQPAAPQTFLHRLPRVFAAHLKYGLVLALLASGATYLALTKFPSFRADVGRELAHRFPRGLDIAGWHALPPADQSSKDVEPPHSHYNPSLTYPPLTVTRQREITDLASIHRRPDGTYQPTGVQLRDSAPYLIGSRVTVAGTIDSMSPVGDSGGQTEILTDDRAARLVFDWSACPPDVRDAFKYRSNSPRSYRKGAPVVIEATVLTTTKSVIVIRPTDVLLRIK
jgi:hypothetical protein